MPPAPRAPSSKFASVPYPHQILHRPKLLKNQGQNLLLATQKVTQYGSMRSQALQSKEGGGMPTCKWLAACANSFCEHEQGNVQQGLPVVAAVNKEATKGMCCHFLWSTRRTAKGWVVWLGKVK